MIISSVTEYDNGEPCELRSSTGKHTLLRTSKIALGKIMVWGYPPLLRQLTNLPASYAFLVRINELISENDNVTHVWGTVLARIEVDEDSNSS